MSRCRTILIGVTVDLSVQFHRELARRLAAAGCDVHFVSSEGRQLRNIQDVITVHSIRMVRPPRPLKDLWSLYRWIQLLRRVRPDIVMVGTPKASMLCIIAARIVAVPRRIYFVHGLRFESATGLYRSLLIAVERLVGRSATDIVAVSKSVLYGLERHQVTCARGAVVIGHGSTQGVDLVAFHPATNETSALHFLRK